MRSRLQSVGTALSAIMLAGGLGVCQKSSSHGFDRLVETWRWSHYWFGKTGIDEVYVPGKQVKALIFWTKKDHRPKTGLCSFELSLCVAYSGPYLDPQAERMPIEQQMTLQQAFLSFVNGGFGGAEDYMPAGKRLDPADFDSEERAVTLPDLDVLSAAVKQTVPEEAPREAERLKRLLPCGSDSATNRPRGCEGTLVFAFYGPSDPYWFVWRACPAKCEFGGDAIEELTRGDRGWEVTSSGFIDHPKAEVERLKRQVQKAEMFRLNP